MSKQGFFRVRWRIIERRHGVFEVEYRPWWSPWWALVTERCLSMDEALRTITRTKEEWAWRNRIHPVE